MKRLFVLLGVSVAAWFAVHEIFSRPAPRRSVEKDDIRSEGGVEIGFDPEARLA